MVWVILWGALHCLLYMVLMYCDDGAKFCSGKVSGLNMPSIRDLDNTSKPSDIDKYAKEVICPSYHYFILDNEFTPDTDSGSLIIHIFVEGMSFIFMIKSLFGYLLATEYFVHHKFLLCIAAIIVPLLLCLLLRWVLKRVYCKWLSVPEYRSSEKDLRERFLRLTPEFSIDQDRAFQNFVILNYCSYYMEIKNTLRKRKVLYGFVSGVSAIVYFMFFFGKEP